jgi:undecaprenyl phosphate-alpha-L-ara4FN deformylase
LAQQGVKGSFFFSVGQDNMGRHLFRLFRPRFFWKMLRTRASRLYGWDILLKGTIWPGPVIGERLGPVIRSVADFGHEVGLHAWDHHCWQAHLDSMDAAAIRRALTRGVESLTRILGHPPICSAVPGWKCNDLVLKEKEGFGFRFNSDCRGTGVFRPIVEGQELSQPQVPVTLPTYDEWIGRKGVSDDNYNDSLLALFEPGKLHVLAVHAEVEGISCLRMFERFVESAKAQGHDLVPLGSMIDESRPLSKARIAARPIPGREGWISFQEGA